MTLSATLKAQAVAARTSSTETPSATSIKVKPLVEERGEEGGRGRREEGGGRKKEERRKKKEERRKKKEERRKKKEERRTKGKRKKKKKEREKKKKKKNYLLGWQSKTHKSVIKRSTQRRAVRGRTQFSIIL